MLIDQADGGRAADAWPAQGNEAGDDMPEPVEIPFEDLLYEAALSVGMPDAVAEGFAASGVLQSGPVTVSVRTLFPDDEGPIIVNAVFKRPKHVSETLWLATLLILNANNFGLSPSSFALDAHDGTVLAMRLEAMHRSPPILGAALQGAVRMCLNLLADPPPLPPDDTSASDTKVSGANKAPNGAALPPAAAQFAASAAQQAAEAPDAAQLTGGIPALQNLMRQAALVLKLPPAQVERAADEGRLSVEGIEVRMTLTSDETALVISADAGADTLKTAAQQRLALRCSLSLMACAGMSIGYDLGQAVLSYRWPIDEQDPRQLASWIVDVIALSACLRQHGVELLDAGMSHMAVQKAGS